MMIELYALNNPLMTILFITPFRRHFFNLIGIEWAHKMLKKIKRPAGGTGTSVNQQMQIQQNNIKNLMSTVVASSAMERIAAKNQRLEK